MNTLPRKLESLTVVVPGLNEFDNLPKLYDDLTRVLGNGEWKLEILFIDDGSNDGTIELCRELNMKDPRFQYAALSRNFGHQKAVTAGLDMAWSQAVVVMDADLQDPPEVVLDMIKVWGEGADVVYGQRRVRRGGPFYKKAAAKVFYRMLRFMSGTPIPVDTGDFRLMDRRVVDQLRVMREQGRYIRGMVSWIGFDQRPVVYDRPPRYKGESKYPLFRLMRLAWEGVSAFSAWPLRMSTIVGVLFALVAFLMVIYYTIRKIFINDFDHGWASIMVAIFAVGGAQLFFIGVVGEYLAKAFEEVKERPLYIVRESSGKVPASN